MKVLKAFFGSWRILAEKLFHVEAPKLRKRTLFDNITLLCDSKSTLITPLRS